MTYATIFGEKRDLFFMECALEQARRALDNGEVPIGAIVVDGRGVIIGVGHNEVERNCCQSAHAEMIALQAAGQKIGNWRLNHCWLYVTLEPCSMCMSLASLSRVSGVVYGANSPLFGYRLDNRDTIRVYKEDALVVIANVCNDQSAELLKVFFKRKRTKDE